MKLPDRDIKSITVRGIGIVFASESDGGIRFCDGWYLTNNIWYNEKYVIAIEFA